MLKIQKAMDKTKEFYQKYLQDHQIRHSVQRDKVLDIFLSQERHLSIAQLYDIARKKYPKIGYATVYRAMNIICKAGIAEKIDFGDGISRFEHKYGHEHHDHLICVECGNYIEVIDDRIEALQQELARAHKFILKKHKLQLFGLCNDCANKLKSHEKDI
jgi:Fur family ferric uptake transcriptional regulator